MPREKFDLPVTNQKHYPDLGSDASSVWNFWACFSDIINLAGQPVEALGTLSKDDDDGSENDGEKMNLRSFKLNRVCLDPLNMSNEGDFSWS